jgi:tetratricopeptide (TPR) repeat protein
MIRDRPEPSVQRAKPESLMLRRPSVPWRRTTLLAIGVISLGLIGYGVWISTRFDPFGRSKEAYERHQYRDALARARQHLKRFPGDSSASLMAARCLSRLGNPAEAETFYDRAGPLDFDDLHARALGLIQLNDPDAAARVYEKILAQRPEESVALKRLAAVRMAMKQWRLVLELANRMAAIPAEQVSAQTMVGIAHHELKHFEQSVSAHVLVLKLDPKLKLMPLPKTLFWTNLAMDLMALGRDDEARDQLTRALGSTHDASLMELLGLTYSRQGKTDAAERCWRDAQKWDPDNADLCLDLGRLELSRKHLDEAIALFKRAAASSPAAVEPLYNLNQAYRMLGNIAEADRYRLLADQQRKLQPMRSSGMGADLDLEDAAAKRVITPERGSQP